MPSGSVAERDFSGFRADFAHEYPSLQFDTLTEPQIYGYNQQIGVRVRRRAELASDLLFMRLAPVLGITLSGQ